MRRDDLGARGFRGVPTGRQGHFGRLTPGCPFAALRVHSGLLSCRPYGTASGHAGAVAGLGGVPAFPPISRWNCGMDGAPGCASGSPGATFVSSPRDGFGAPAVRRAGMPTM
jgi:hypothetical protein